MKPGVFVGIDTSNYTTSAALCTLDGEVIANLKAPLPVKEGERGLRQSDAVFSHVRNLPGLMNSLREAIGDNPILAVGVSSRPREAEDSYMPCFLSGVAAAEAFGAAAGVPVYRFSHQDGHIMAAVYSSGANELLDRPFAAFHVSGGTTEVLHVLPAGDRFSVEIVGGTNDLNAGQVIDRVGVMMGLRFPCGKEMEALARTYSGKLPAARVSVRDGYCDLSGLENLAGDFYRSCGDPAATGAFVFSFLGKTLCRMTEQLDEKIPGLPVVYAGGVMSNRILRETLSRRPDTYFAEPAFSADNAAGISLLCRRTALCRAAD